VRHALGVLLVSTLVGWLPSPVAGQETPFEQIRAAITEVLAKARTFQSPEQALQEWGEPLSMQGLMNPRLTFSTVDVSRGRWPLARLTLAYGPPARAPERLESLTLETGYLPASRRAEVERGFKAWFGEPASGASNNEWRYREDLAGLGLRSIQFGELTDHRTQQAQFAARLVFELR
jgi:hypothetical protein